MSKTTKIILVIVLLLVLGLAGFFGARWWQKKMVMIEFGLAEKTFPFRAYTQEELNKMYPQIRYADVPTRVIPEETYATLRQALIEGNIDKAVECFVEEKRGEWRRSLNEIKEKGLMKEMVGDLGELKEEVKGEAYAQYSYSYTKNDKVYGGYIEFSKDANGDWKIESL